MYFSLRLLLLYVLVCCCGFSVLFFAGVEANYKCVVFFLCFLLFSNILSLFLFNLFLDLSPFLFYCYWCRSVHYIRITQNKSMLKFKYMSSLNAALEKVKLLGLTLELRNKFWVSHYWTGHTKKKNKEKRKVSCDFSITLNSYPY